MKTIFNAANSEYGFSIMEIIVSISIFLIISSCLSFPFYTAVTSISKSIKTMETAVIILQTDRLIRKEINAFNIPYFMNSHEPIERFKNNLWYSGLGKNIKEISVIYSNNGIPRGLNVQFNVNAKRISTCSLFPVIIVVENNK